MNHVNEIKVVGNIGKIELRETAKENLVLKISVVAEITREKFGGGEYKDECWFNVELWLNKKSEADAYMVGQTIEVNGTLRTRSFKRNPTDRKEYYTFIQPTAPITFPSIPAKKSSKKA